MPIPRRARLFVTAMISAGALILAASLYVLLSQASPPRWLVFAGLAIVTGSCVLKLPRVETRFSLSDALVLASALLIGPACAAAVAAVDAVAASLRFNQRGPSYLSRTLFNAAAAAVSIWVPAVVFVAVTAGTFVPGNPLVLSSVALPLVGLVAGYSLLNTGAIAVVLGLTARTSIAKVWRENFAWLWIAHAWSGMVAITIAIYVPHVNLFSLLVILAVGIVGYATVRVYLRRVEESTGHLHKLNGLYLSTIEALAMAIDAKDQVTHGHIRRVQVYAVGLAKALGVIDEPTLKGIEAGALLHDTGKIAVPEYILNKPGKLTPLEYEQIKTHVTIGAEILGGIDFPYPVIPFVRHHHENWDGTGYPDGLAADSIPLGARILSVVDCFDALTSDRPYRRALPVDAAVEILRQRAGTMYDARVVEKFIEVYPQLAATLTMDLTHHVGGARDDTAARTMDETSDARGRAGAGDEDFQEVARLAAAGLSAEDTTVLLIHRLERRLDFTTCAVFVPRASDDRLDVAFAAGPYADLFRASAIRLTEGLSGWVAAHGQFLVNANPALDLRGPMGSCAMPLASALVVPFPTVGGSRGALALYAEAANAFTLDHARTATAAAACLGLAFRAAPSIRPAARVVAA